MITRLLFTCGVIGICITPLTAAEPTFSRDVAPILYKHCVGCHRANDIAPMPLITYKEVRPWAASVKAAVLTRKMPPWKADPHYGQWSNDPSLTAAEVAVIKEWADGAKLEGDPNALPAAPVFVEGWKIGKPDLVISVPEQKLEAKGPDVHVTLRVPTGFTEDRWIVAAELRPGNRKIVHHAHIFVIDPDRKTPASPKNPVTEYSKWLHLREGTETWIRPDAPVINDGCAIDDNGVFPGATQNDLGSLVGSYLPGRAPDAYPEGTARKIPAGASLDFRIHYSRATGNPETDITSVGFIFAKEPPKQVARRIDLSNHMFLIPAGATSQQVSECHTFQKDMYITSLTPHMHLRGKSMRFEVTYPDGRKEILLNVPEYNFNWQITYRSATPIFIPKGTRLAFIAHFDNSANNPMNPDPKVPVRWGSASENEMMDGWVEYVDTPPATETTPGVSASFR